MARITVEDCLKKIPNRFQMVLVASVRARQLSQGHTPKIECKDKDRKSTRLNSSHNVASRMPSSA